MQSQNNPSAQPAVAPPTAPGPIGTPAPNQPGPTNLPRKHGSLPAQKPASPRDAEKILRARDIPSNIANVPQPSRLESVIGTNNPLAIGSLPEQARALKNDVDLIYEYVRDTIEFSPNYGLHKGAIGAMVDGSANAFDQSDLMVQLLQQAGYTAKYVTGTISLNASQWSGWLGVDSTNSSAAQTLLSGGGIPVSVDPATGNLLIGHCWVSVVIGGTTYVFDPAFKLHNSIVGVSSLDTAMNFVSATDFLSAGQSGENIGWAYVQNVNDAGTTGKMDHYSSTLGSWIRANNPGATLDQIIGGRTIIPHTGTVRQSTLPYQSSADLPVTSLDEIYKAHFRVRYDYDASLNSGAGGYHIDVTFRTADVYGLLMTLFFNTSDVATLRVAGTAYGANSRAQTANTFADLRFTVTHPYVAADPTFADEDWTTSIKAGANTAIGYSWGMSSKHIADIHQQNQNQSIANGLAANSEQLLGFSLLLIWDNFIGQSSATIDIASRLGKCGPVMHHAVGTVCQTPMPSGKVKSLSSFGISYQLSSNVGSSSDVDATGYAASLLVESLEGTASQQVTGVACADAIRLIRIANQNGTPIYVANASNWAPPPPSSSVQATMSGAGYTTATLNDITNLINNGFNVVLPANGLITYGAVTGLYGYVSVNGPVSSLASWTWFGAKGAISSDYQDDAPTNSAAQGNGRQVDGFGMPSVTATQSARINMLNGRFEYSSTDITVGNQGAPYELSFTRSYNSDLRLAFQDLGYGWSHNWQIWALSNSDGFIPLGDQQVLAAVPAITTLYVLRQVHLSNAGVPLDNFVISCIAANHFVEGMVNNVVRLQLGGSTAVFTKMPDGTYLPGMGMHGKSQLAMNFDSSTPPKPYYVYTTPDQVVHTFNTKGQLSTIAYPFGITITCTYNVTTNKLTSVSNGVRTLNFAYDAVGMLHTVNDGTGVGARTVTFTIPSSGSLSGNLTAVTDLVGNQTTYSYDSPGRLTQVFMPANPTSPILTNVYDTLSRVEQQSDAYNNVWLYYFAGTRSEEVAPDASSRSIYFNGQGSVVRQIDALGHESTTTYDGNERPVLATMPEGNSIAITYDADGNMLTTTQNPKPGSGLASRTTTSTYESVWNKVATVTDADGNTSSYEYVARGLNGASQIMKATGHSVAAGTPITQYTYNSTGQSVTATDPTGVVTTFHYDATNLNLLSISRDPAGINITTAFGYDNVGNATSITDAMGQVTTVVFDDLRRAVTVTGAAPLNPISSVTYDANGNVLQTQSLASNDPNGMITTTTYAIDGKPLTVVGPANFGQGLQPIPTRMMYDNRRRLVSITDAAGHVTTTSYDVLSRPLSRSVDGITQQSATFTQNGFIQSITDARGKTTTFEHDGFDRVTKTNYPDSSFMAATYDQRDNVIQAISRAGLTFNFVYDTANQLTSRTPSGQPTLSFGYDLAGRSLTITTPAVSGDPTTGTFSLVYDSAGRVTGEQFPDGKTVSVVLDASGRATKLVYPDGSQVTHTFDEQDRLTSVSGFGGSTVFSYDSAARRISQINGNKTGQGFGYDKLDNLIAMTIGNLKPNAVQPNSRVDFSYGSADFPFGTGRNVNDPAFNWTPTAMKTVTYGAANDLNQYPSIDSSALSYDANGCLTSDGQATYQYDSERRLVSVTRGSSTVQFKYDPLGRLTQKVVGASKTRYLYAGVQRIEEYDTAGSLTRRYIYGRGMDECLFVIDSASNITYLHADELGSIILTSDATGAASQKNVYSPWGELSSGSLATVPIGYTGQFFDADAMLYYFKARHYSPTLGRFMQPDPIGLAGGSNFYAYCGNDPVSKRDSLGLGWEQVGDHEYNADLGDTGAPPPNNNSSDNSQDALAASSGQLGGLQANLTALGASSGGGVGSFGQVGSGHVKSTAELLTEKGQKEFDDMFANWQRGIADYERRKAADAARLRALRAYWKAKGEEGRAIAGSEIDQILRENMMMIVPEGEVAGSLVAGWAKFVAAVAKKSKSNISGLSGLQRLMRLHPDGLPEQLIQTPYGGRRVDLLHDGPIYRFAREAKSGVVSASAFMIGQALKDAYLIRKGYDVEWHIFTSPYGTQAGLTKNAEFVLNMLGIPWIIRTL